MKIYVISNKKRLTDRKNELTKMRQPDHILDEHYQNACDYFKQLTDSFSPLREFVNAPDNAAVVKKYRHSDGGSVLFRPIGLKIVTEIIAGLVEKYHYPSVSG